MFLPKPDAKAQESESSSFVLVGFGLCGGGLLFGGVCFVGVNISSAFPTGESLCAVNARHLTDVVAVGDGGILAKPPGEAGTLVATLDSSCVVAVC